MILAYITSCLLLAATFHLLHIWPQTKQMTRMMRLAFATMFDKALSDDEKEVAIRRHSIRLLAVTVKLSVGLAVVLAACVLPVAIAEQAGLLTYEGFLLFSLEPLVVILTIVGFGSAPWLIGRLSARKMHGSGGL
ncbi:hypothetical protein [Altererythrobacter sp.]|uniref:hypothetical protein n=1 Tax=Altererythrobacter sp. TaxID=1872480 RepID=UPI003CFED71D